MSADGAANPVTLTDDVLVGSALPFVSVRLGDWNGNGAGVRLLCVLLLMPWNSNNDGGNNMDAITEHRNEQSVQKCMKGTMTVICIIRICERVQLKSRILCAAVLFPR